MKSKAAFNEAFLFFGLTLGLTYLVFWGPLALFQIPTISFVDQSRGPAWAIALFLFGGFVPSLVALFLIGIREGAAGLRRFGRRVVQFNIGWRWYLTVIAIVLLVTLWQLVIIWSLGQNFDLRLFALQLSSLLPLIILGPLSEELGWRGYALERLQTRLNTVVSALVVGIFWAFWHLPLFFIVGTSQRVLNIPFLGFACGITALSVIFAWLQNNTHGSIWTAIFFHWMYTYFSQVVASGVIRSPIYNWLEYLPYIVMAVVVIAISKSQRSVTLQPA